MKKGVATKWGQISHGRPSDGKSMPETKCGIASQEVKKLVGSRRQGVKKAAVEDDIWRGGGNQGRHREI